MRIESTGTMGTAQNGKMAGNRGVQADSHTKNIQNQIANAQKKLQELSSNEELSLEEKMKRRQEIQQEINNLNQLLRQHQIEQRKELQSRRASSADDRMVNEKKSSAKGSAGLSQAGMQAMISADSSRKQVKLQGSIATRMEGRAGVLAAEIKQDAGKGNTEKKEAELADIQEKAQSAAAAQMSALADAKDAAETAAKEDRVETRESHAETAARGENNTKSAESMANS